MSYRSLICCLTILFAFALTACIEDEEVIPDRLIQIPGSAGKTVKRSAILCCNSSDNCRVGRQSWQRDLDPAGSCESAGYMYYDGGDKVAALKYHLKALDHGNKNFGRVETCYNEAYGDKSHRSKNDPVSDDQREAEDKMISLCQNSSGAIDSKESERFCERIASVFSSSKREQLQKRVLKTLCDDHRSPSACWELKEYKGEPFTMEMYRSWAESERRVAAIQASAEQTYSEQAEQEQAAPVEEEPDPEPVESSPSWGDAAVQAINATRGQDPVQSELNRQLARINAASRQPPPVRTPPPAPERTSVYRPAPVVVPAPIRPYESIAVVPSVPTDKPAVRTDPPPVSNSSGPGTTSEPTKEAAPAQTNSSPYRYEPGSQFDGCIGFFYDPTFHNWYSIQNSCSVDITWVSSNPSGAGDVKSGGVSCLSESQSEVAQHLNRLFAFCRKGFVPVDAQDHYWRGGQYRCKDSR
jgi:hypothetical protein